jgi:hypothetical protein
MYLISASSSGWSFTDRLLAQLHVRGPGIILVCNPSPVPAAKPFNDA